METSLEEMTDSSIRIGNSGEREYNLCLMSGLFASTTYKQSLIVLLLAAVHHRIARRSATVSGLPQVSGNLAKQRNSVRFN
jgi:hypothetical protein